MLEEMMDLLFLFMFKIEFNRKIKTFHLKYF